MKFTARAGDLRDAFEHVSRVVPKSPSQAVYAGVRLRVRDGQLSVTGSAEGDTTITVTVPVANPVPGDKVLLPKPISAFLATLPPATLLTASASAAPEITVEPEGAAPYTFRLMEATFPNTSVPAAQEFTTDLRQLAAAVRAVKDCASKNKVVQVVSTPGGVLLHATDGLRLARAVLPDAHFGDFSGLLPLGVLEQIAERHVTQVALDKRARVFTASNDTLRVVARVVDEMFPNVSSVLDDIPPNSALIPTDRLLRALVRLSSVADKRPVVLTLAGDQLTLSPGSTDVGSGQEQIELDTPVSSEITFAVNLEFLRDAISAHPGATVELGWSTPFRPVFMRSNDPLPVTTVVMPVKLS